MILIDLWNRLKMNQKWNMYWWCMIRFTIKTNWFNLTTKISFFHIFSTKNIRVDCCKFRQSRRIFVIVWFLWSINISQNNDSLNFFETFFFMYFDVFVINMKSIIHDKKMFFNFEAVNTTKFWFFDKIRRIVNSIIDKIRRDCALKHFSN